MRRRNMYYATGLPGWMRLGYSPGWMGRSPGGLGPCAQHLMAGQWPAPMAGQPDRQQQLAILQAGLDLVHSDLRCAGEVRLPRDLAHLRRL